VLVNGILKVSAVERGRISVDSTASASSNIPIVRAPCLTHYPIHYLVIFKVRNCILRFLRAIFIIPIKQGIVQSEDNAKLPH
jgi:hypothetical protein